MRFGDALRKGLEEDQRQSLRRVTELQFFQEEKLRRKEKLDEIVTNQIEPIFKEIAHALNRDLVRSVIDVGWGFLPAEERSKMAPAVYVDYSFTTKDSVPNCRTNSFGVRVWMDESSIKLRISGGYIPGDYCFSQKGKVQGLAVSPAGFFLEELDFEALKNSEPSVQQAFLNAHRHPHISEPPIQPDD